MGTVLINATQHQVYFLFLMKSATKKENPHLSRTVAILSQNVKCQKLQGNIPSMQKQKNQFKKETCDSEHYCLFNGSSRIQLLGETPLQFQQGFIFQKVPKLQQLSETQMTKPIPPHKTCTSWSAVFVVHASPVLPTSRRRSMLVESKIRKILIHTFIKRTRHSASGCTCSKDVSHKVCVKEKPCQVASELWYLIISTKPITISDARTRHKMTSSSGYLKTNFNIWLKSVWYTFDFVK